MSDNDRILCQVLEQQLSLRLREACRGVLLHVLPAPLRGLLYIAQRSSAAGYARLWTGVRAGCRRQLPRAGPVTAATGTGLRLPGARTCR